jgi:hypothetical protein
MPNQDRVAEEFEQRSCVWDVFFDIDDVAAIAAENLNNTSHDAFCQDLWCLDGSVEQ